MDPIPELIQLALDGLGRMFDERHELFCDRRLVTGERLVNEGSSFRYTIMALLGLNRCKAAGIYYALDTEAVMRHLVQRVESVRGVGDLGLVLWLYASTTPDWLRKICTQFDLKQALQRFEDGRAGKTTELAWLLAGLSHARMAVPKLDAECASLAGQVYDRLLRNQGPSGIFGHQASTASLRGMLRGRIGSFADQVYPIYALAHFGRAFDKPDAIAAATRCAQRICELQGTLGQWWWHYDAGSGKCVERYPVYSVHQDGMAPMALFALDEVAGSDFSGPVYKGLRWILGANEPGLDLRDRKQAMIWRSLYHGSRYHLYRDRIQGLFGGHTGAAADLEIKRECRPYHFGWLLYAFAGASPQQIPLGTGQESCRT